MLDVQKNSLQVICDLREIQKDIHSDDTLQALWREIEPGLVGKVLEYGKPLALSVPQGKLSLWSLDAQKTQSITENTAIEIVDVLRRPTLLYRCQVCGDYGPLRCATCVEQGKPEGQERLCTNCARFIKDRLTAFCPAHQPLCQCSKNCQRKADFFCSSCYHQRRQDHNGNQLQFYNNHVHHTHPKNPDIDYCDYCYNLRFNRCPVCQKQGKTIRPGKLRCAFKTVKGTTSCGEGRCWEHSFQWKIWGVHNAGITLCEYHHVVSAANPADLLLTMVTVNPPRRHYTLNNIFRLRRILNRDRSAPLSFEQLGYVLRSLSTLTANWDSDSQQRYAAMLTAYDTTMQELPQAKQHLLLQIKQYYSKVDRSGLERQIVGLEIADKLFNANKEASYEVDLLLKTNDKRPFVGAGGSVVRQLESQLKLRRVTFWYVQGQQLLRL